MMLKISHNAARRSCALVSVQKNKDTISRLTFDVLCRDDENLTLLLLRD